MGKKKKSIDIKSPRGGKTIAKNGYFPTLPADADRAEEVLSQLGKIGASENPIGYLKAMAQRIADTAELNGLIAEFDRLEKLYPPETNNYLAPNGKLSNLNYAQWYVVRTRCFKKWFGDWEAAEIVNQLEQRNRLSFNRTNTELEEQINKYYNEPDGWRKDIINWAKKIIPDVIKDSEGKDVEVTRNSIRKIISHGKGPLKILTLPKLEEMLSQGVMYHKEAQYDEQGRKEYLFNFAYPIHFDNKNWLISMTVKEDFNGKRVYDNEFVEEIKSMDESPNGTVPSTRGRLTHPSMSSILRKIISVNSDSVSKAVDENGEPKPVSK